MHHGKPAASDTRDAFSARRRSFLQRKKPISLGHLLTFYRPNNHPRLDSGSSSSSSLSSSSGVVSCSSPPPAFARHSAAFFCDASSSFAARSRSFSREARSARKIRLQRRDGSSRLGEPPASASAARFSLASARARIAALVISVLDATSASRAFSCLRRRLSCARTSTRLGAAAAFSSTPPELPELTRSSEVVAGPGPGPGSRSRPAQRPPHARHEWPAFFSPPPPHLFSRLRRRPRTPRARSARAFRRDGARVSPEGDDFERARTPGDTATCPRRAGRRSERARCGASHAIERRSSTDASSVLAALGGIVSAAHHAQVPPQEHARRVANRARAPGPALLECECTPEGC